MKKHLTPVARKFGLMGFDIRTKEQKAEDDRRADEYRRWTIRQLASRYDREKIYEEIWSEPIQRVAKRYDISDVGLAKVCKRLNIPRPGRGYWAIKAAGKPIPKRPPLSREGEHTCLCRDVSRLCNCDKVSPQFAKRFSQVAAN